MQRCHGFSAKGGDGSKMVVVAVSGALVSALNFPAYREIIGKVDSFGFRNVCFGDFCSETVLFNKGLGRNSLFFREQGIFRTKTRNAPV
jgi:hypothetical protein